MPTTRAVLALALLLAAVTVAVFLPVKNHAFLLLDDNGYVTENRQVRGGLSLEGLVWSLAALHAQNWHPLTWMSHMLDVQLYGLEPQGHHVSSLALHTAAAVLLFVFLVRATGALWAPAATAALFALHPLRAESVAWVAERKDVLAALIWVLTLLAYRRWLIRGTATSYLAAVGIFALGLASKPMLVTLPFVLLLADCWPFGRLVPGRRREPGLFGRLLLEKVPFLILAAVSSAITYVAQSRGAIIAASRFPLAGRVDNALVAVVSYLWSAAFPARLSFYYPLPGAGWPPGAVLAAAAMIVLTTVAVFHLRRRQPWLGIGWLWYLGALVPVIGLVQVGLQARADRYTYVPLIGISFAAAWCGRAAVGRRRVPTIATGAAVGTMLVLVSSMTWRQVGYWRNNETLAARALELNDSNWLAHKLLGDALADRGDIEAARRHHLQSLQTLPGWTHRGGELQAFDARRSNDEALVRLEGEAGRLLREGKADEVVGKCSEILRLGPANDAVVFRIGGALVGFGRPAEAVDCFRQALQVQPDNAELHYNLGVVLYQQGKAREAAAAYLRAIDIEPSMADAHHNLGVILAQTGQLAEAIAEYREALHFNPTHEHAAQNLHDALAAYAR